MKRIYFFAIIYTFITTSSFSQKLNLKTSLSRVNQNTFFRLDYLNVDMPDDIKNMGFVGGHFNFMLNKYIYSGVGLYGSVTGEKGGLFTLGANLGIVSKIYKNTGIDIGVHYGGGGGGAAPVGGGAMVIPHAGIKYKFKHFDLGVNYSYLSFYDGDIESSQLKFHLDIPLRVSTCKFSDYNKSIDYSENRKYLINWNNTAFKRSFSGKIDSYFPLSGSKITSGKDLDVNLHLVGFEYNHYLTKGSYLIMEANGAFHGIQGGYMDVFTGYGFNVATPIKGFSIHPKFTIGAGGGGAIETEGGLLIHPKLGLEQNLTKSVAIHLFGGFMFSPTNRFNAITAGVALKHYALVGGTKHPYEEKDLSELSTNGWLINLSSQTYFQAQKVKTPNKDLSHISLQFNYYRNRYLYLAGEGTFAYIGNAGAYAEGLIGIGATVSTTKKLNYFAQFMAGTGGGGGVDTEQGVLVKPSVGINYSLTELYGLQLKVGQIIAPKGRLNSTFVGIGVNYTFSSLNSY